MIAWDAMNAVQSAHAKVEWSIKAQLEVIRAKAILAEARIDRHVKYISR